MTLQQVAVKDTGRCSIVYVTHNTYVIGKCEMYERYPWHVRFHRRQYVYNIVGVHRSTETAIPKREQQSWKGREGYGSCRADAPLLTS